MTDPAQDKFTLTGGDAEFGSRAKNIFAGLESLEAQHVAVESTETARRESYSLMKPDPTDEFISSDSAKFQVPSRPPPKRIHSSSQPGYESSPSKWKRYDLSDVTANQLTEQSNQSAAKDFLSRFQIRPHDAAEMTDSNADDDGRHIFRKPDKKPETSGGTKRPVNVKHYEMEDNEEDDTEDVTRTQILSFADDELNDSKKTVGTKEQFRRQSTKRNAHRQARGQIDNDEEDDIGDTVSTEREPLGDKDMPHLAENRRRTSDSDSDSDNFSELAQLGSDSDQEDNEMKSHSECDNPTPDVEKYAPEDVDLDSID